MDDHTLNAICSQIYRRFPEVNGTHPKIQAQGDTGSTLLTFRSSAKTENGHSITRLVRVVASEKGKILKVSTSR